MELQEVASSATPWLAAAGGVSALAGTLVAATSRHRVATRLRADLAKDFELLKQAEVLGEASAVAHDLTEMIQAQVTALADRTVYRSSVGILGLLAGSSALLVVIGFVYLSFYAVSDPSGFREMTGEMTSSSDLFASAGVIALALGFLGLGIAAIARLGFWLVVNVGPAEEVLRGQFHRAGTAWESRQQQRRARRDRAKTRK